MVAQLSPHRKTALRAGAMRRRAMSLLMQREWAAAEQLYRIVLSEHRDDFDATHMLGVIALQTDRAAMGVTLLTRAVKLRPAHSQALANLGTAYLCVNQPDNAVGAYEACLKLDPQFLAARGNFSSALQKLGRHEEAVESFAKLLQQAPEFEYGLGDRFYSRRYIFDWRDFDAQTVQISAQVAANLHVDRPFSFLSVSPSAALQLQCARTQATRHSRSAEAALWRGERYGHKRIVVAYVSADFREHVVLNLLAGIFQRHDKHRFLIIGVSLAADDGSDLLKDVTGSFDIFLRAGSRSDAEIASWLREQQVDIAIDLTGYTQGARTGIFARRPAPVQVNFLGYPGTMGASFIDYIIADDFVAPPACREFYAEHIVRLPGSFQASAIMPSVGDLPSRSAVGLPEGCLVMCCFNNGYKLNPAVFDSWARILTACPDAVLWLLAHDAPSEDRLLAEAAARGLAADRLRFAGRVPYAAHLARLRIADLFLDTWPFNAGATASDALRVGVPVQTLAGQSFASRMAGSLLTALDLTELIAFDVQAYERSAIELIGNPRRLVALRKKLETQRDEGWFDVDRYRDKLEAAFIQMWERSERGETAAAFTIDAGNYNATCKGLADT